MADYVNPPIETDPSALADDSVAEVQARIPEWEAAPAGLATILLEAGAFMAAEGRDVASDVPRAAFRYLGARLHNLPPVEASPASVDSTWTAIDNAGYTIDAGTIVGVRATGDELVLFEVDADVVIPPGSVATAAGEVALVAQEASAEGNGLGGVGVAAELVDALVWVQSVVLTGVVAGGADAEDDDSYLNRLVDELQLQSPRPILPRDFALLAQRVGGVDRALAVDLYKPADQPSPGDPAETNRERSVTVYAVDADGEPVGPVTKAAVLALLSSMRETNFEVWADDPTYQEVAVDFAATAYPGWDTADVLARATAAVEDYLSPADWGVPPLSEDRQWLPEDRVRYLEVAEVLNRVDGLRRVDSLAIGGEGLPLGEPDVYLGGLASLPRPGTVTGAVAAS